MPEISLVCAVVCVDFSSGACSSHLLQLQQWYVVQTQVIHLGTELVSHHFLTAEGKKSF